MPLLLKEVAAKLNHNNTSRSQMRYGVIKPGVYVAGAHDLGAPADAFLLNAKDMVHIVCHHD
jgi:hypothetical protein